MFNACSTELGSRHLSCSHWITLLSLLFLGWETHYRNQRTEHISVKAHKSDENACSSVWICTMQDNLITLIWTFPIYLSIISIYLSIYLSENSSIDWKKVLNRTSGTCLDIADSEEVPLLWTIIVLCICWPPGMLPWKRCLQDGQGQPERRWDLRETGKMRFSFHDMSDLDLSFAPAEKKA